MRSSRALARTAIGTLATILAGAGLVVVADAATAATVYQQVSTISLGHSAGNIAVDPAEHRAYIANGTDNTVTAVDTTTNTVTKTITGFNNPGSIAVDTVRHLAYVTDWGASDLAVIDTTTDTITRTIALPATSFGVAVDSTTGLVYVPIYWGGQDLAVVDPSTDPATITQSSYLESRPWAAVVDPTTHLAYVTTLFGGSISVMNGTTNEQQLYVYGGPSHISIDPTAHHVYVNRSGAVRVIDTTDNSLLPDNAPSGNAPAGTAVDPTTHVGYTANNGDNTVTVFDTLTDQTIATVSVSHQPNGGIEVDPATHDVYVSNSDNTVSVIKPLTTQAINFTSTAPSPAQLNGHYQATATGGGSSNPVTYSSTTTGVCTTTSAGYVTFAHPGSCVIAADQAGDNSAYAAAPTATQTITVAQIASAVAISVPASVYGETAHATATITPTQGPAAGTVTFTVDGNQLGTPVTVVNGSADSADLIDNQGQPLSAGSHTIGATFNPTSTDYASASNSMTDVVNKAASNVEVTVGPNAVTATVAAVAPGVGLPTGTVDFNVDGQLFGQATLNNGVAELDQSVPTGSAHTVAAVYAGDSSFDGASASTSRQNPSITATIVAAPARTNGWYRGGVRVRFSCTANGAPLTTACPATRIFGHQGAAQSVTRTILAADGGAATVTVDNINIDRTLPSVALRGAGNGSVHRGAPRVGCVSNDKLSGVASCRLTQHSKATGAGRTVHYRVVATDKAGNRRSKTGSYTVLTRWFVAATYQASAFLVRPGRTYTLVVTDSTARPTYYWAAIAPHRPTRTTTGFRHVGAHRWALRVRIDNGMRSHALWNVGVKTGKSLHIIRLRVIA